MQTSLSKLSPLVDVVFRRLFEDPGLYFLQHGEDMSADQVKKLDLPEISEAEKELKRISQERALRVAYEQRMKAERDAIAWEQDKIAEWKKLGLDEGKKLGIDEGKKLGIDEGKKLGIDEGKKLGIPEGKKQALLQVLAARGLAPSPQVQARIAACTDPATLDRYLLRALSATTAEDLFGEG